MSGGSGWVGCKGKVWGEQWRGGCLWTRGMRVLGRDVVGATGAVGPARCSNRWGVGLDTEETVCFQPCHRNSEKQCLETVSTGTYGTCTYRYLLHVKVGSYKSRLARAPRRGVLAYDRTTATTHFLGFQKWEWYHGAAGRVISSTLARITPREVHSSAILARFTNCLNPYV